MMVRVRLASGLARGVRCGLRDGHDEAAVLHASEADHAAGKFFYLARLAVDDEDFEAGVVVEVSVAGGDDQGVVGVLEFGQLLRDAVGVMVVDEGDGADDGGVLAGGLFGDKAITNEIAEGLGAIGVAEGGDEGVKADEEIGIECNADAAEDAHGHPREMRIVARFEES